MTSAWHLRQAARRVRAGGIIAYPTEAVFGLGCDPLNAAAVQRLLDMKGRAAAKGLILIAADLHQLEPYIDELPASRISEILQSWPGPVTWVVPAAAEAPSWLSGGRTTLAVRVTGHAVAADLCRACGIALVSTSANLSGQAPALTALHVRQRLGGLVDYLVPGQTGPQRKPTTIRDALSGAILRA